LHRFVANRLLSDLSFHGKLLPVFLPREDPERARRQKQDYDRMPFELAKALSVEATKLKEATSGE
jgi:hypothetical protein